MMGQIITHWKLLFLVVVMTSLGKKSTRELELEEAIEKRGEEESTLAWSQLLWRSFGVG